MAAVCNFAGATAMLGYGSRVAVSVYEIAGLSWEVQNASAALTAAMTTTVLWALVALYFGLPTSESHALLAALSGAAVNLCGISALNGEQWLVVAAGLLLSTVPVIFAANKLSAVLMHSNISETQFKRYQILGAALSSFAHGAQDGQKFAGVFTVAAVLASKNHLHEVTVPIWTAAISALLISLGMLMGGKKIIKSVCNLASEKPSANFAADLAAGGTLVVLSVLGVPVSTTHAKTMALIGAGGNVAKVKTTLLAMVSAWLLTFPVCAVVGYLLTAMFKGLL